LEQPGSQWRLMYAGIGLVFALLLAMYFVYQIRVVALVMLLTALFSIIVSGPVDFLERRGLGRAWGTMIVLGVLALVLGVTGLAMGSLVGEQAQQLAATFPALLDGAQSRVEQLQERFGLETGFSLEPQGLLESARNFLSGDTVSAVASVGASVANVLSLGLVVLISTVYAVARPKPLVNGFVSLFPAGWRGRVREVLGELYETVQRWFLGQLTSMFIIGFLFTISLAIIGVPYALLLGILSGLLAFVPYVGALLSVIAPILLALVSTEPLDAVWVLVAYGIIQAIEGNLIQPIVMSRAVELHPVVVVFALLIMGTLFGLVGVLLAIPLVASLQVLVRELWVERMDEQGTDPNPPGNNGGVRKTDSPTAGRLRRAARSLLRRS
jgi:predicted PurR-regulated permease PerM